MIESVESLPETIYIGGSKYKLIQRCSLWRRAEGVDGQVRFNDMEVDLVTEGRPASEVLNTLFHELCHVVWREYHLPSRPREERTVTVLGYGWTALLAQNPALYEAIGELLDAARSHEA